MPRKKHSPKEIVTKLRQVDVTTSEGRSIAAAVKAIGGDRDRLLQVAIWILRAEDRSGEAAEGVREGEFAAARGVRSASLDPAHVADGI